jgi:hypothetical protein
MTDLNTEIKQPAMHDRRTVLRKLAAGGIAVAGCAALPERWLPPMVEFATLPAHAATSAAAFPDAAVALGLKHRIKVPDTGEWMQCDSINQAKIRFPKLGPEYGPVLLLIWSDGTELHVSDSTRMAMNPDINDFRKYQPGGQYSNNPDIPTMEVYARRGTRPSSVTLYYK